MKVFIEMLTLDNENIEADKEEVPLLDEDEDEDNSEMVMNSSWGPDKTIEFVKKLRVKTTNQK